VTITNLVDPDCRRSASVVVSIRRNLENPLFTDASYEFSIPETEPPYVDPFGTIQASDSDRLVSWIPNI